MSQRCTRCGGTGFLNYDQVPEHAAHGVNAILDWLEHCESRRVSACCSCHVSAPCSYCTDGVENDVSVCDCCGDGEGWYGQPGEHYGAEDPQGPDGPYAYNGGLCECH